MTTIEYSKTGSISIVHYGDKISIISKIVTNELVDQIFSSEDIWEEFYDIALIILGEECEKHI